MSPKPKKTLLSWSSGKDSAWALHVLRRDPAVEIAGMFTVISDRSDRVSMHSTRAGLLRDQADAAGMALRIVRIPDCCTNEQYDAVMARFTAECAQEGIECMAFGDLSLEDVRRYRERRLKGTGIAPLFPLWGADTLELAEEMLAAGLETYISCVDLDRLPAGFAGRIWTRDLIGELPPGADPCGENGEFHTIVTAGPMFGRRIRVDIGGIVLRDGFAYADIIPAADRPGFHPLRRRSKRIR
ncbi:MAG TPA: adenine nucleotide alpha hydrolase [Deltaproteobacteria bacterium]|nr:adenine nucleotide alpha hydrolase [Deltaproteobacteria bacterium]